MFKLLLPSTIVDSLNKRFAIKQDESLANLKAIDIPPVFKTNIGLSKRIRNKELRDFYNTLMESIPDYDFPYMHRNINTLRIYPIYIQNPKFFRRKVAAYYNCIKNTVRYTKNVKDKVLPHELLHMASTVKRDEDTSIFSGFSQSTKLGNYELIGRGLNEGYTQYLAEKYFDVGYRSYPLEVLIAAKLEDVITEEKMEKMYFNADLKGLVHELLKYIDEKAIIMFMYAIDFLGTLYGETDIEQDFSWIKKAYFYVVEFLLEIKTKKLMETETNLNDAKKKLRSYAKSFQYKIVNRKENKEVILLDKFVLEKMIKNYIGELNDYYVFNRTMM